MHDGAVVLNELSRKYDMDLLGNLTPTAGGYKQNGTSATFTHAVNATNEITTLTRGNPAGSARVLLDPFDSLSDLWEANADSEWSVSSGKLQVDAVPPSKGQQPPPPAILSGPALVDDATYQAKITLPTNGKAGVIFSQQGDSFKGVEMSEGGNSLALYSFTSGGEQGYLLASTSVTINADTEYTLRVRRQQRRVEFELLNADATTLLGGTSYDSSGDWGDGTFGMFSWNTDVKFDNYTVTRIDTGQTNPAAPRWVASAKTTLDTGNGKLTVETPERGGVSKLEWAGDDDYIAQADIDLNGGDWAELIVRYHDPDNYYAVRIEEEIGTSGVGDIEAVQVVRGYETVLADDTYSTASSVTLKVKISGTSLKAWVGGTLELNTNGLSDLESGGVALAGEKPKFSNVKVGYDNNADDDIDDAGDDLVVNETFGSTTISPAYDDNGNLTDDGTYKYTYDAWNRLVKVTAKQDTDLTIQTARYDALGRRVRKVVSNSGVHDGTTVYYYHGWQIVETRDGSGNLTMQAYHGTQYIDELIGLRLQHGRVYVHQDANWNVTSLTDLSGKVLERYYYSPYGQLEVVAETYFGDYNADGKVDATDAANLCTNGCTCSFTSSVSGDCRVFDFDCDGDLDESDQDTLRSLYTGLSAAMQNRRIPSLSHGLAGNPFFHQCLVLDPELRSYQNRARQYSPRLMTYGQRDPLRISYRFRASWSYRDGLNMHGCLRNNPLVWTDPLGRCCDQQDANGSTGWVCCDSQGNAMPCVNRGVTDPCVRECVREHEQEHSDHMLCECNTSQQGGCQKCPGRYTGPTPPSGPGSECAAYTAQVDCMSNNCTSPPDNPAPGEYFDLLQCMTPRICAGEDDRSACLACGGGPKCGR